MNVPRSRLPFYTQDHQSHKIAFHSNCKPCQHQTSPIYRDFKQQRPSPLSPPSAFIPSSMPVFCSPALKESLLVMLVILLNDLFAHFFCRFHFLLDFIPLKDYNEHMHKPVSLCIYLISLYLNLLLVSLYPSQDVVCVCECMLAQSCPTFCNLMDCMLPGFSIHGILQGRILEWVAMSFSRGSSRPRGWTCISCIAERFFTKVSLVLVAQSCLTLWDPMDCIPTRLLCPWDSPGKEYWSGLPCPPPGHLPDPGIEPASPTSPILASGFFATGATLEAPKCWSSSDSFWILTFTLSHTSVLVTSFLTLCIQLLLPKTAPRLWSPTQTFLSTHVLFPKG